MATISMLQFLAPRGPPAALARRSAIRQATRKQPAGAAAGGLPETDLWDAQNLTMKLAISACCKPTRPARVVRCDTRYSTPVSMKPSGLQIRLMWVVQT